MGLSLVHCSYLSVGSLCTDKRSHVNSGFLNPESEKQVTRELCDEEIVAMVNHDRAKEATIWDQNLGMIPVVDSD